MNPKRIVGYVREVEKQESEPDPTQYDRDKWANLDLALESDADAVVIAVPEILGDSYTELIINLGKVAASGKMLAITRSSPRFGD